MGRDNFLLERVVPEVENLSILVPTKLIPYPSTGKTYTTNNIVIGLGEEARDPRRQARWPGRVRDLLLSFIYSLLVSVAVDTDSFIPYSGPG